MSITDELREIAAKTECANGRCEKLYRGDLEHIADRIDAEHEREMAERDDERFNALMDARERGVNAVLKEPEGFGLTALPKDADGEYIRIGDVMEAEDNYIRKVDTMQVSSRKWSIGLVATLDATFSWHDADRLRHYHAPTVEDVLRQVIASANNGMHVHGALDTEQIVAEYAGKLKLASDK